VAVEVKTEGEVVEQEVIFGLQLFLALAHTLLL
jgi:hypothetical protein